MGLAPEVIDDPDLVKHFKSGLRGYRGLKEDEYFASFRPDPALLKKLDLHTVDIVARIRPPATEAHNPESKNCIIKKSGSMKTGDKNEAIKNTGCQEGSVCSRIVLSAGPMIRGKEEMNG